MKISFISYILLLAIPVAAGYSCTCSKPPAAKVASQDVATVALKSGPTDCKQGILIVRGICKQRVISIIADTAGLPFERSWKNPDDGKVYTNVFTVSNICDFPDRIQEGDTLNFKPIALKKAECNVCMAYVAVPQTVQAVEVTCP